MIQTIEATPTRVQVRDVLRRHKGSVVAIARHLNITHVTVSLWLAGKVTSARVATAAEALALQLLDGEARDA